jgi:putative transposase
VPVKELCRKPGFSDVACCGSRAKFGGMQVDGVKRLKVSEAENAKLKKTVGGGDVNRPGIPGDSIS